MARLSVARRIPALLFSLLVLASMPLAAQPAPPAPASASERVPGQYIVVFRAGVTPSAAQDARDDALARGGTLLHTYTQVLHGFAARLSPQGLEALRRNPNVDYIEEDQTAQGSGSQSPATWGLDRIDQLDQPLDAIYAYSQTGQGVYAFVLDSGLKPGHLEFTDRVLPGRNFINTRQEGSVDTTDCHGHGTHVTGTLAGSTWGVAKQVAVVPVRVLDCNNVGPWSGIIAGVDWAVQQTALRPAVINMSIQGSFYQSVNTAVASAVQSGLTTVVAGGNYSADACATSPAAEPSALTVGATSSADARASFSNYGTCLDLFAPGALITSAGIASTSATQVMNGTSMATPHVAGMVALILQANPTASPRAIAAAIEAHAGADKVSDAGAGSPNLLAYSPPAGFGVVSDPPPQAVAVSAITGTAIRKSGGAWQATATVAVYDPATTLPVPGATVHGSFSPGASGQCVTGSGGSCALSSSMTKSQAHTDFSVTGITGSGMQYSATANAVTTVRIDKP